MTRDDFATAARALVGLTYPDPAYLALVAPGDTGSRQLEVGRSSGCMLTRAGLEEALGLFSARGEYKTGSAPATLEERAGGSPMAPGGACRRATLETPPQVGDGLWWGASTGFVEHVDACVVEIVGPVAGGGPASFSVRVVAGGQRDAHGNETVLELQRDLLWLAHGWVDRQTRRPLVAILDAELYPEPAQDPPTLPGSTPPPAL